MQVGEPFQKVCGVGKVIRKVKGPVLRKTRHKKQMTQDGPEDR